VQVSLAGQEFPPQSPVGQLTSQPHESAQSIASHAPVALHVTLHLPLPQLMLPHALLVVHWIVQAFASPQSMALHADCLLHEMSHVNWSGQWTEPHSFGDRQSIRQVFAIRSQPPLQSDGHCISMQNPDSQIRPKSHVPDDVHSNSGDLRSTKQLPDPSAMHSTRNAVSPSRASFMVGLRT
jgi:hypothetical protein